MVHLPQLEGDFEERPQDLAQADNCPGYYNQATKKVKTSSMAIVCNTPSRLTV